MLQTIHICMSKQKRKFQSRRRRNWRPAFSRELLALAAQMIAQKKLIPLKDDVSFKLFLSAPTPESNACLRYFLSAVTGREVVVAKVTNSEVLPEYRKGKMPRLDVNCEFNDGQKADIELQLTKADDDQKLRSIYYACKLYAGSLGRGEKYKNAPNVYQIFLIDFDLFEDGEFYHRAMMRLDDGKILADRLQVLFFSLKVPDTVDANLKKAANWCKFISGCTDPGILDKLRKDEGWKEEYGMAMRAYNNVSAEEKAWAYHLSMDRAEADYWNGLELAEEKGREAGKRQGERNKALSAARKMLADGMPLDKIVLYTDLTPAEVEKLATGTEPVLA